MKKLLLSLAVLGSFASADLIGVSVGAGLWQENIDGYIKKGDKTNYLGKKDDLSSIADIKKLKKEGYLGLSDEVKPYVWAKIIHPIPLIPNVKAEYRQYDTSGSGVVVGGINMFGSEIDLAGTADTKVTMNSYDVTLFYELRSVMTLGFELEAGVGVNVLKGDIELTFDKGITEKASFTAPIPYLYGRVETPKVVGFSMEAEAKYIDVGTAYYHDYQGAVKYHLPIPVIDVSLSLGVKQQEIYGEDGDDSTLIKFSGAYAEVGARW